MEEELARDGGREEARETREYTESLRVSLGSSQEVLGGELEFGEIVEALGKLPEGEGCRRVLREDELPGERLRQSLGSWRMPETLRGRGELGVKRWRRELGERERTRGCMERPGVSF